MSRADWIFAKREQARKLHLAAYRRWIDDGAKPNPIFWRN